jgi:hypothetical protein
VSAKTMGRASLRTRRANPARPPSPEQPAPTSSPPKTPDYPTVLILGVLQHLLAEGDIATIEALEWQPGYGT